MARIDVINPQHPPPQKKVLPIAVSFKEQMIILLAVIYWNNDLFSLSSTNDCEDACKTDFSKVKHC